MQTGRFRKAAANVLVATALVASASSGVQAAPAGSLNIGLGGAVTTIDPHFFNATPNQVIAHCLFDRLTERSPSGRLEPGLALSWKAVTPTVWEMKLRPNVKWSDGKPFTADDVLFTINRARNVPNSPGGFSGFLRDIAKAERVDDLTLRLVTPAPAPNLPAQLAFVAIVSRHAGEGASTDDYNAGRKTIGTGPYKLVKYVPGDRVELERNDAWWGPKQPWQTVTFRLIPNPAARVSALLAGGVDVIDDVPPADLPNLSKNKAVHVASIPGMRLIFLALNFKAKTGSKWATDTDGKPLAKNPMLDRRVRLALSESINRTAIADRLMQKTAVATGQWLPPGAYSYANSVKVPPYDVGEAKKLLAEAGFPQGFKLTLQTPNDRYPNDAGVAQAVAQMWSRIGVQTTVDARPWNVYQRERDDYMAALWGWGSPTLEAGYLLSNVLETPDKSKGHGVFNFGNYSNPQLDSLTDKAMSTLDDGTREKLLVEAVEMASRDVAMIPLLQMSNFWATRVGYVMTPRMDERTLPINVAPEAAK
ncbi:ABC transporter substrate-binding protein [Chitinasiproducens palmae]|uniref:Peptide/nickel transport system substrate-binding protein n=1 Tax=Chitinasiproducens palmae TaxID=1770053 RepID=A0A1H2PPT1_9BURK|nr:ABC transporter substrate-binding protein [Chitinasiproducens palmae]SDV48806.1 peptide/nickel transport system substrate-binding protein [Chitinasiproducens palmae]